MQIKILKALVNELIIHGEKLNVSINFTAQSYFTVPRNVKLK